MRENRSPIHLAVHGCLLIFLGFEFGSVSLSLLARFVVGKIEIARGIWVPFPFSGFPFGLSFPLFWFSSARFGSFSAVFEKCSCLYLIVWDALSPLQTSGSGSADGMFLGKIHLKTLVFFLIINVFGGINSKVF